MKLRMAALLITAMMLSASGLMADIRPSGPPGPNGPTPPRDIKPGLSIVSPPRYGVVLWPAGARVQQMLELTGKELSQILKGQQELQGVRSIFVADYIIPGPPAAPVKIIEFYTGTLRPPTWQPFFQSTSTGPGTASIAFKGPRGYISVLARPNGAIVTYIEGDIQLSAIPILERVIRQAVAGPERGPMEARDRVERALCLRREGRTKEALHELRAVVAQYPMSPIAHFELARLLSEQKIYPEAAEEFRRAIGLAPLDVTFRAGYAHFLIERGDLENAQHELEQAATMDPWSPMLQIDLGRVLESRGLLREAEQRFRQALGLAGAPIEAYIDLGRILEKQGKRAEALAVYRDALKLNPGLRPALDGVRRLEN